MAINRSKQISRRADSKGIKDIHIELHDIDHAIKYYFNNFILPRVDYGEEVVNVPLIYANAERWASIQKKGYITTIDGQIQCPVIAYKRTSVARDDEMINTKIDPQNPQIFYTLKKKWSEKNRYSKSGINNSLKDEKQINELLNIVVPDYVILTYECIIWTDFISHMNKIIETINYNANTYWGDDKFKFRTKIDEYSLDADISGERIIKGTFTIIAKGYIIPDIFAKVLPNTKEFEHKKVIFGSEKIIDVT